MLPREVKTWLPDCGGRTLGESWPPEPTSSYASIDFWCQLVASPATAASWTSVSLWTAMMGVSVGQYDILTVYSISGNWLHGGAGARSCRRVWKTGRPSSTWSKRSTTSVSAVRCWKWCPTKLCNVGTGIASPQPQATPSTPSRKTFYFGTSWRLRCSSTRTISRYCGWSVLLERWSPLWPTLLCELYLQMLLCCIYKK